MSTHTLIYTSVASQKMTDNDLKELLKKSRENNGSLGFAVVSDCISLKLKFE